MQRFTTYTLIDITETRLYRYQYGEDLAKSQQQNFSTLLQTIGMRVNPIYEQAPKVETIDVSRFNFGKQYQGMHQVWTFSFHIEYDSGFADTNGNPTGMLIEDLHLVPIIIGLTETVEIPLPIFNTKDVDYCNTVIYYQSI